jgi:hypothetical protein
VFTCWKIEVEYYVPGIDVGPGQKHPVYRGRLFPNVNVLGQFLTSPLGAKFNLQG